MLPYLYTDNALVQPSNPNNHPVFDDGHGSVDGGAYEDGGVGGQLGTADADGSLDVGANGAVATGGIHVGLLAFTAALALWARQG